MKNFYTLVTALLLSAVGIAQTQMNLPVTFDDATVNYGLVGFGGAEQATVVVDPTLATNKVGKVIKTNTAELWAGATVTAVTSTVQTGFSSNIPFTATEKKMNVRVWSPHAGIKVRLKVEDKNDVTRSVETEATVTTANGWQTLEFDFGNQAAGTAALNLAFAYNKASIFFNFGVTGAVAGERTYYFDDMKFGAAAGGGGGGGSTLPVLPLDFESSTINYTFTDFGGGATTKVANPQINGINTSANVGKMVKGAGEVYGGSFIALAAPIDFSVNKIFKVKVFSPRVGAKLLLKVENGTDGSINFEREVASTVANAWEELTFDYSAISTTNQYSKLVFIFDLGTAGNGSANFTWLFDDVRLTTGGGGGTTLPVLPLDFESSTTSYAFTDFGGGATTKVANTQINGINTSANVAKMVKGAGEVYGGSFIALAAPMDFSVNKTFRVKVFSPRVGAKLLLKVENGTDGSINFEKEATSTVANAWEDLTFDYSAISTTNQYQKLVFIFDLGTAGNGSANFTWLFDDVRLTTAGGGGGGGLTQMNLPVTFDDATVNYGLVGFGGAEQATVVVDPTLATNKVGKVIKTNTAELWAGATVTAVTGTVQTGFSSNIPFTATEKKMNVRVWSPHAGIKVRLKVEDKNDVTRSVETEATVTTASGWQTLEFDFGNQAAGTAALNLAFAYNKASIFFNFGVTGAVAGERTYYFDDMKFGAAAGGGGGGGSTLPVLPLDFESSTINYAFTDFGGGVTTKVANPQINGINTSANVGKMVKGAGEVYGGSFIALAAPIDFSVNKIFKVKVFSPRVGAKLLLKVENGTDGTINFEREVATTVANAWEDLTFDYSAISTTNQYQKLVFIFDLGTAGDGSANFTWLFDDVRLTTAGGGGGSALPVLPLDFESSTINYTFTDFGGGATTKVANTQINGINTSANVGKMVKGAGEVYGGSFIALAAPINFSVNKIFKVKVFSPRVGAKLLLKVENGTDGSINFEKEATSTVANAWEDLTFDYSAISTTNQYQKLVFIFDLGTAGNGSANFTWLFDDVRLTAAGGSGGGLTQMNLPVTFDDATVNYGLVGFGGAEQATVVVDPTLATNKVAKVIKTNTAELWAGTTVTAVTGGAQTGFSSNIPFTATERRMNVRVWSPHAGIQVRLKVEDKNDPTRSVETEATVTTASGWQTLEFNFANQATGTAAMNLAFAYNKASIFFNFGVTGAVAGERTYYFDDVRFGAIPPPAAPAVTAAVNYCQNAVATPLTATATSGNTLRWYTVATGGTGSATAPTPLTTTAGTTNYYVSQVSASSLEGPRALIVVTVSAAPAAPAVVTPVTLCQGSSSQTLTATPAAGNTLSWYTVATGGTAIAAPIPATTTAGTTSYYVSQANAQGCQSARALVNVIVNARPAAPVLTAAPYTRLVPGLTTTLTASAATGTGNTYEWFKNDILLGAQTASSISVNVNELGTYKLQITNAAGCSNMSNAITVLDSTSSRLFVYPNPSGGQFQVRFQSDLNNLQPRTLAVYDGRGSLVFSGRYVMFGAFTPISVDLSNHPDGIYTVYLMDKDGKRLKTERIIISR